MKSVLMREDIFSEYRRPYDQGHATYEVVMQMPGDKSAWYIESIHKDRNAASDCAIELLRIANLKVRIIRSVFDGERFWDKVLLDTKSADEAMWSRAKTSPITKAVLRELHALRGQKDSLKDMASAALEGRSTAQKALLDTRAKQRVEMITTAAVFTLIGAMIMAGVIYFMR